MVHSIVFTIILTQYSLLVCGLLCNLAVTLPTRGKRLRRSMGGPKVLNTLFRTIAEPIPLPRRADRRRMGGRTNNQEAAMNIYDVDQKTMTPNPIRIAVFDDHPTFREGVIQLLKHVDGFKIVGEGTTADDALKTARESTPDVVLFDIRLPGGGIEAAASIAENCPGVRTIVLTSSECEHDVTSALRAGARGYILKGGADSEIVSAVYDVIRGKFYFTPTFAARLLIERSRRPKAVVNHRFRRVHSSRRVRLCGGTSTEIHVRP
jgi:DNA-binding NarL/FixJ family response regulator